MKRYFLVIISAIFSLGGMYADNISVTNIEIEAGETKTVSVCLENTETNLVGFQMDITLPEGITINKSGCALSSRFTDNDQELTIGKQAEGTYRLTSTSLSLNPISGTSGELLTIALTAGESTEGGTANFSNIRFVTSNSERITLSDVSFTISIAITNITFADENVKAICVANWDTNGDGELSYVEAAAVTSLNRVFNRNLEIKTFDELQYFTGLTSISTSQYDTDDFLGCTNLQSVILPPTINAIYGCSFNGTSIRTITLPKSVETIGTWAFQNCDKLVTIISENENVPNYLWSVNSGLFAGCHVLSSILVPSSAVEAYKGANGWKDYADKIKGIDDPISFADENVKALCVQNWDTNGDGELSYVEAAAVTDLGEVFKYNRKITSFEELQYFTGLASIGSEAFYRCSGLTSITIPNSVTSIDGWAFSYCSGLTSITIPNSVTSIGGFAFWGCSGLTSIKVGSGNTKYDSRNNCNAIIESSSNTLIAGCKNTTIPNTVTSIGDYAFVGCSGLTSITIPNSVTSIGSSAFSICSGLTSITIPNSVTSIGGSAFSGCSGLTSIKVEGGNTKYDSRDNCNAIIESSSNTLIAGCKNTMIPNSVTSIGDNAFDGCSGLTSVTIPNSVTSIGRDVFSYCRGLTSVTIPNSVTSIGTYAFYNCSSLTEVTVEIPEPISITSEVFTNRANATLYVPKGSKEAYEAADYWKEFKEIVEMSSAVDDSNSLYADNITALIGNTASFSINMKNTESISGFQFTMTLPEGVSVATDGNGNLKATLSSRGSNAFFNANLASDGTYRCSSFLSNGSFSGEDGELVNFTLDIASDMAVGDYQVKLSNIELTTTSLEKINPSDVSATISVKDYDLGDANGDGSVSITDAVTIVYHINGIDVPNFIDAAADVNKDNSISITDAVSVVYIINGLYTASAKSLGGTTEPGPSYLTLSQKERNALSVGLMNSSEYTAFQMDVKLPETMNVENVVLNKERMGDHSVYFNRTDERTVRISCFSPRGECVSNSMGEILQLVLSGNGSGEVSIDNILFTTTSLDEHELLSISTMATAISDVNMGNAMLLRGNTLVINSDEEKDLNIYTISGHLYRRVHLSVGMNKLEGFQRGVYVINGKKMTIK